MENLLKKIFIIFCLLVLIVPFVAKADENNEYKKGDIKCPDGAKNCTSDKNTATIVEQMGDFKVTKTVSKTNTLGTYSVKFHIEGGGMEKIVKINSPYVVVVVDISPSMKGKEYDKAKKAITKFSEKLQSLKANMVMIHFAEKLSTESETAQFQTPSFSDDQFTASKVGDCSQVEVGLRKAYELLSSTPKDANKYMVLFGDGAYTTKWSCWNGCGRLSSVCTKSKTSVKKQIANLSNLGVISYTIRYKDDYEGKNEHKPKDNNGRMIEISGDKSRSFDATKGEYEKFFDTVFGMVSSSNGESVKAMKAELTDNIGKWFSLSNSDRPIYKVESTPSDFGPFYIKIDKSTKDLWNETNANFSLETSSKTYTSKVNPLVYWKAETAFIPSCSGSGNITNFDTNGNDFYKITCEQGWNGVDGYTANLTVNGLPVDTYKFNLNNGFGFPINVNIKSNLRCTYEFYKDKYLEIVNNYNSQLSKTSDEKERASISKNIDNLNKEFNNYVNMSNNLSTLNDYKTRVENQDVTIHVKYKDSKNLTKDVMLVNSNIAYSNLSCEDSNTKRENISGQSVVTYRRCSTSTEKNMQMPLNCLSMKDGEVEDCVTGSNTQISGGNSFYVPLTVSGGYISAEINDATYFGNDIKLEGESKNDFGNPRCEFTNGNIKNNTLFRQIELSDPFIQIHTNKTRKIGNNWDNNKLKYNFVKIIKDDIWDSSKKYQYKFDMSKVDIKNIRINTSEEGVSSYLGRNCYFGNDNKYICEFIRTTNGKSNGYFTNIYP